MGYISSFGIKLKRMERLAAPFGDCIRDGRNELYIYEDYIYTTEGCFRSCYQAMVVKACGCGDPRFPLPKNTFDDYGNRMRHCWVFNPVQR